MRAEILGGIAASQTLASGGQDPQRLAALELTAFDRVRTPYGHQMSLASRTIVVHLVAMADAPLVQFKLMLPANLKNRLEAEARKSRRSLSQEIVAALEEKYAGVSSADYALDLGSLAALLAELVHVNKGTNAALKTLKQHIDSLNQERDSFDARMLKLKE